MKIIDKTEKQLFKYVDTASNYSKAHFKFTEEAITALYKRYPQVALLIFFNTIRNTGVIPCDAPILLSDIDRYFETLGKRSRSWVMTSDYSTYDPRLCIVLPEKMSIAWFKNISTWVNRPNNRIDDRILTSYTILPNLSYLNEVPSFSYVKRHNLINILYQFPTYDHFIKDLDISLFEYFFCKAYDNNFYFNMSTINSEIFINTVLDMYPKCSENIRARIDLYLNQLYYREVYASANPFYKSFKCIEKVKNFLGHWPDIRYPNDLIIKSFFKTGMSVDDAFDIFKDPTLFIRHIDNIPDDRLRGSLLKTNLGSRDISRLIKYRPTLFSEISGKLIDKIINNKINNALPIDIRNLINDGIINIKYEIEYEKEAIELLLSLKSFNT